MSIYLSSVVSAPAYQTCFSTNPSTYLNLSIHHQDRFKNVSTIKKEEIQFATDSTSNPNHSTSKSNLNSNSNSSLIRSTTKSTSNPSSPLASSTTTRARAMGNLTEAIERRRAKENIESVPSFNQLPKPIPTTINTRRDEKKALGLRAAVGSYKMRCSGTKSLSASPVTSEKFVIPIKPPHTSSSSSSSSQSKPLDTATNMTWVDTPESRLKHSQYLAARRESIIGRVGGGHRRVVSESISLNSKPSSTLRSPTPSITTLPSLDQISSWVALRKNHVNDSAEEDLGLQSPTWAGYSMGSSRPMLNVKSKSLPIFSHARDPSIPRICLSPDSDEEEEGHDQSDETQSEPPTSAIPIMLDTSGLLSANPTMERSLDFKCALIATTTSSSPPNNSSNHRAVQRQALLANLALARRRRTTTTTTMNNEKSTPQFVAPV